MRGLWLVVILSVIAGCGGSPTKPDSVSAPEVATVASPNPPPAPEPVPTPAPVPAPDPPAPPVPAPAPPGVLTYHATTTNAHWYGQVILPDHFDVRISEGRITFGPLTAEVVFQDAKGVFARPNGASLQLVFDDNGGSWSYSGGAGDAGGTLVK